METREVEIREATAEDWSAIHPFFERIVADGDSHAYQPGLTSEEARASWYAFPPGRTVVAVVDGAVAGTAMMGPNRPGRGSHVGHASFMVDHAFRGIGVGRALGEHVVAWAREEGYRGIQFNAVVETNTAAVRLWTSLGFEIVGTVPEAFDHPVHGYVGLHVMYLRLV